MALPHISQLEPQAQTYMVQAIVRQAVTVIISDNASSARHDIFVLQSAQRS